MVLDIIRKRRSIRKYEARPVEEEKTALLFEAALRSPSSRGYNPWRFILVTEPDLLDQLSRAKPHGSSFLKGAPLGIVVCGDEQKSDAWIEDCSIACAFIQLTTESLDLGSCWIQIRGRPHDDTLSADAYIAGLLDLPREMRVEAVIAVGYPDESKPPHGRESLQYEKARLNTYGMRYTDKLV